MAGHTKAGQTAGTGSVFPFAPWRVFLPPAIPVAARVRGIYLPNLPSQSFLDFNGSTLGKHCFRRSATGVRTAAFRRLRRYVCHASRHCANTERPPFGAGGKHSIQFVYGGPNLRALARSEPAQAHRAFLNSPPRTVKCRISISERRSVPGLGRLTLPPPGNQWRKKRTSAQAWKKGGKIHVLERSKDLGDTESHSVWRRCDTPPWLKTKHLGVSDGFSTFNGVPIKR